MNYLRENQKNVILCILVISFAVLGLLIRLLPMQFILGLNQPVVLYEDPWYTVRQVEQILPHFPQYSWFDPMLSFPDGKVVDWGPVFPLFASILAILAGAGTHEEIILAIGWAPVILGLLLIPLSFLLGRIIWDTKTGWIAAMLISVVGGETLFRSFYGDVDHHIMEVVLTSLFFICYFYLFSKNFPLFSDSNQNDNRNLQLENKRYIDLIFSHKKTDFIVALLAGFVYYLGIMTMPTCSIVALTVGVITFFIPSLVFEKERIIRLFWINSIIFSLFILLYLFSGVQVSGWSFRQYTYAHLIPPLFIILESFILFLLSSRRKKIRPFLAIFSNFLIIGLISGILFIIFPTIIDSSIATFSDFFGLGSSSVLIQEMQSANLLSLLKTFNLTVILGLLGLILLIYHTSQNRSPLHFGILIWTIIYLGISLAVVRYQYYGGQIIVILTAVCLSEVYQRMNSHKDNRVNKKKSVSENQNKIILNKSNLIIGIIIGLITLLSMQTTLTVISHDNPDLSINNEWLNSLTWLKNNSYPPGIDYYASYTKDFFKYPDNFSTVVSWWDEGHWILGVSHLSPATTPFQDNVRYVAKYLLSENNSEAEKYADYLHTRYVITTNDYIFDSFPLIQQWLPQVPTKDPYIFSFYLEETKNIKYTPMVGFKSSFYNTTLAKLHVNDGSYTPANGSVLLEYQNTIISSKEIPVLKKFITLNQSQNAAIESELRKNQEIISLIYTSPVIDVPALENYRLIYESEGTETFPGDVTLNNIKIFERVKGHTIPGTGTIELPLVTNQGREFVYRQESINNTFTLPYSTTNTPYDVHATGPYRIIETNETINVDESQIERYYK